MSRRCCKGVVGKRRSRTRGGKRERERGEGRGFSQVGGLGFREVRALTHKNDACWVTLTTTTATLKFQPPTLVASHSQPSPHTRRPVSCNTWKHEHLPQGDRRLSLNAALRKPLLYRATNPYSPPTTPIGRARAPALTLALELVFIGYESCQSDPWPP